MKRRKRFSNYVIILGLAAVAAPLYATTVEYASRSSWVAAVSGVTTTTFDTAAGGFTPPAPDGAFPSPGGLTLDGVTFQGFGDTGSQYTLNVINPGPGLAPYYNWGTGGSLLVGSEYQGALAHFHISFATAVTAWGTDMMLGGVGSPGSYSIQINGGACPTACLAPTFSFPTPAFFGMTSTTAFSFIDLFVSSNGRPELDNFSTATASGGGGDPGGGGGGDTPEIGTILLCAAGLISLAKYKKLCSLSLS